ncbi:hypothetical protein PV328_011516 [Microctonus aethiopoides]|uniref:RanBP-type and C3HC4-type zinc finger-containing protein 1 n=1 Tax=Microctonus aethiopoides TaxID=144406 RepID=A0AA39C4L5_9HYME|nr:hypothetical protein PV328_011516 [Microctonus aethiopoides]
MVERSGCNIEESSNDATLHHDGSTANNNSSTIKNSFQQTEIINNSSNNRFSIFKWFKRNANSAQERPTNHQQTSSNDDQNISEVSSSESVDTYYSTATVKSFAFHSGTLGLGSSPKSQINSHILDDNQRNVGPFASGASKVIGKIGRDSTNVTQTLPANVLSRSRDITTRYSLQSCAIGAGSYDNINDNQCELENNLIFRRLNNRSVERRRVHVKGKRRAPNPPGINSRPVSLCVSNAILSSSGRRKRRPAPKPPELIIPLKNCEKNGMNIDDNSENHLKTKHFDDTSDNSVLEVKEESNDQQSTISNDTLVLRGGVLLAKRENLMTIKSSTSGPSGVALIGAGHQRNSALNNCPSIAAMPRPWYKRSVFENSSKKIDNSRVAGSIENKNEQGNNSGTSGSTKTNHNYQQRQHQLEKSPNEGSLSRLKFFHRDKNIDDKRKDVKRRSGLSILTNISELDKEAAAIVQEEQARTRALLMKQTSLIGDEFGKQTDNNQHEVIQNMVTSAMESSPRRGTRALISKFNAIGNITKVTVNSSFFNKNTSSKEPENSKIINDNWRNKITSTETNAKVHPDLSRYFPQCGSPKIRSDNKITKSSVDTSRSSFFHDNNANKKPEIIVETKISKEEQRNLISDVTERLTALQSVIKKSSLEDIKSSSPISARSVGKSRKELIANDNADDNGGNIDDGTQGKKVSSRLVYSPRVLRTKAFTSDGEKKSHNLEAIQREFTNIFEAMDKQQLNSTNFNQTNQLLYKEKKDQQVGTSSQVSKVLDILVNTQKIERDNWLESNNKSETKPKTQLLLNKIEDPTTMGLKEMLKEMKHSLPKRPKPKRTTNERLLTTNNDQTKELQNKPNSHLLNHVKVNYPPIIHTAPMKKIESSSKDHEINKIKPQQKVSSGVQTSGNIRKKLITNNSSIPSTSQSQFKYDEIVYKTMTKKFQLMRPREFAAIGAIKTMQNSKNNDNNTYANVIEQSLYANALVLPSRNHQIISNNFSLNNYRKKSKLPVPHNDDDDDNGKSASHSSSHGYLGAIESREVNPRASTMADEQRMNTMAVNRLIKKLEGAIASGNHQQAAEYAKELATLKIQCSVVRHRAKINDLINLDMYIEDRLAHQGPIALQLPLLMTVGQLKEKISNDFNIPANVQRWIINNTLADNNDATLDNLHATEGSPVFLYLVAPDLQIVDMEKQPIVAMNEDGDDVDDDDDDDDDVDDDNDEEMEEKVVEEAEITNDIGEIKNNEEIEDKLLPILDELLNHKDKIPKQHQEVEICRMTASTKPETPLKSINTKDIILPMDDVEEEGAAAWVELEPEEYQELIALESCDIAPNTVPIDCPICFVKYKPYEAVVLRDCLHAFCRECLVETIKHCDEALVKCPYGDADYACESTIQEREIKALVDEDLYDLHLIKSISQAENNAGENGFHCKTPDCSYWCLYEENINNFMCPVCNKTNCITCRAIHEGQNCLEYQEYIRLSKDCDGESKQTAAVLANMLDRGEAMKCSTCNVVVMKKLGCDWVKCTMCKTELCWVTKGPRWGPGGPGDISGGCRCKVNGIKCHPLCSHCH